MSICDPVAARDNCRFHCAVPERDQTGDSTRLNPGAVVPTCQTPRHGALSYLLDDAQKG